jgi:hypothetical protein
MNVASPLAENDDFARRSKLVVMFQKRGHPRLYEHNDMSLGTLDPLHVYVNMMLSEAEICGSRKRRHPRLY